MRVLAGMLLTVALYGATDKDMQRAINWERHKDQAAARQARQEKRRPTVTYTDNNSANRSAEEPPQGTPVKDPGPGKSK